MTSDGHHYNPNQPRVPAGHARGGQWTSGEHGPRSEEEQRDARKQFEDVRDETGEEPWSRRIESSDGVLTFLRDGQLVWSQSGAPGKERNSVRQPGGNVITFEQDGNQHRIYAGGDLVQATEWSGDSFVPSPVLQLARRPGPRPNDGGVGALLQAALAVYLARSKLNWSLGGDVAALTFDARALRSADQDGAPLPVPVNLTEKQVRDMCKKYDHVQQLVNTAAQDPITLMQGTPQNRGTAIHVQTARQVNGGSPHAPGFFSPENPRDENFRAEFSLLKALQENPALTLKQAKEQLERGYAAGGTIRIDVLENVDGKNKLICVYDIKTGNARLTPARILEITQVVARRYPTSHQIIIMESRPRLM
jgi:hypothetical protein